MVKSKDDAGSPATTATSSTQKKVRGLLDVLEAEAAGEDWVLDDSDPLALIGLGLGASPEARRLALMGLLSKRMAEIDKHLSELKRKRGRPKGALSVDLHRAVAVLVADDLYRQENGEGLSTQKAAIEYAVKIEPALFGDMTSFKRLQTSVSKGLRELGPDGERFSK